MDDVFRRRWPRLGAPLAVEALPFDARVSNRHFRVQTPAGTFLLKQLRDPNALYGTERGTERLETVARCVEALGTAGLPVEQLEPSGDGSRLVIEEGVVLRVFRFIAGRGYDGSPQDRAAAARAQRRLHDEGEAALPAELLQALRQFGPAFPIAETAPHVDEAFGFLRKLADPEAEPILRHESYIRDVLRRTLAAGPPPLDSCLVHLDLHPENVIFENGRALLIDLDNLLWGPRFKCVAFSVMRFTPGDASIRDALHEWLAAYAAPDRAADTIRWMRLIELEKILRIVLRVARTGAYANFLPNVATRHVPSLQRLETL